MAKTESIFYSLDLISPMKGARGKLPLLFESLESLAQGVQDVRQEYPGWNIERVDLSSEEAESRRLLKGVYFQENR